MKAKKKYAEEFIGITPKEYEELEDRHKKVLTIFSKHRFDRILDVGCGDGNFSIMLKEACNAKEVYGIEISEKGVESAKRNGVNCFQLDIDEEDFPFSNDSFDAVYCGEVIEHLYDPDHLVEEIFRTMKKGGVCVINTPNLASLHNRIALVLGFQPFSVRVSLNQMLGHLCIAAGGAAPDHIRHFTTRALVQLLRSKGFEIERVYGSPAVLPDRTRFSFLAKLERMLSIFPSLSYRLIVVCKKETMRW
ncbi:MAG: putative S-adenosylmethionine-dependent methyltransferase [candidate division WS2 bacterium]|nr:putative S-adenosylmethionine-dependent methyltransferase [Candidatus Psychracetigena formicireducens]